jgi:CheY-like chemotaxis protein
VKNAGNAAIVPLVTRHTIRESRSWVRIALRIRQSWSSIFLLAEDNTVNQTLAGRPLEKRGYTVLVALEKERFDLILMDVQMPNMEGFKATAAIRAKEKLTGARIPILAMTAHALKGDQERCVSAVMDGYVSKPIEPANYFLRSKNCWLAEALIRQAILLTSPMRWLARRKDLCSNAYIQG